MYMQTLMLTSLMIYNSHLIRLTFIPISLQEVSYFSLSVVADEVSSLSFRRESYVKS